MPLVAPDPVLARAIGPLAVEAAMLRCGNRLGAGQARGALDRCLGDSSPLFAARVQAVVNGVARSIRTRDIKVVLGGGTSGPRSPEPLDLVEWRPVTLSQDFLVLPLYLPLRDHPGSAAAQGRSQFCELAGALTHRLAGDWTHAVAGAAATAQGATVRAQVSANTLGAFIEAAGVHGAW